MNNPDSVLTYFLTQKKYIVCRFVKTYLFKGYTSISNMNTQIRFLICLLFTHLLIGCTMSQKQVHTSDIYSFSSRTPLGDSLPLDQFKNKVILIVNTATECGLTPQFDGLEDLHQKYKGKGLVVLGFPCNQFGSQEPLSNESMVDSCRINHGVTFQLTEKIDVNGNSADPIYKFLKSKLTGTLGSAIKWNFTKFLIGPDGKPFKRYAPTTKPEKLESDIENLLSI